jgi:hypothetical protein
MKYSFKKIVSYAMVNGVAVEKTGRKYECWNMSDHSIVAESDDLAGLYFDVEDLISQKKAACQWR